MRLAPILAIFALCLFAVAAAVVVVNSVGISLVHG
jgi:hypothetical protein